MSPMNPNAQQILSLLTPATIEALDNHFRVVFVREFEDYQSAKAPATKRKVGRPAKSEDNRAEFIRGYLDSHPNAKPAEVVAAAAKQGIEIGTQYVSNIKTKHVPRKTTTKKAKK